MKRFGRSTLDLNRQRTCRTLSRVAGVGCCVVLSRAWAFARSDRKQRRSGGNRTGQLWLVRWLTLCRDRHAERSGTGNDA